MMRAKNHVQATALSTLDKLRMRAPSRQAPPPPLPPNNIRAENLDALKGGNIRVMDNGGYVDLNQISALFKAYDSGIQPGKIEPLQPRTANNQVKDGIYATIPDFRPDYPAPSRPLPSQSIGPKPPSAPPPQQPGPPLPPAPGAKKMKRSKASDLNQKAGKNQARSGKKLPSADQTKHRRPPKSRSDISRKAASQQQKQSQSAEASKENDLSQSAIRRPGSK